MYENSPIFGREAVEISHSDLGTIGVAFSVHREAVFLMAIHLLGLLEDKIGRILL
jgi:hypothetical protein